MTKPRLLDLFCGAGGAARGYQMAGFHVTGVDLKPQPRYAGDAFIQGDALAYVKAHGHEYDAIHASPPCQGYSRMRHLPWLKDRVYPLLIPATRAALVATGRPFVIENVAGAPLENYAMLCGTMFGLKVYRHRLFETSFFLLCPPHAKHREVIGSGRMLNDRQNASANGWVSLPSKGHRNGLRRSDDVIVAAGHFGGVAAARAAMGIDWMTRDELSQAIPPSYTLFIGAALLRHLTANTRRAVEHAAD